MKGQAFVGLPSERSAEKALRETNGYVLYDKPLVVVSFYSLSHRMTFLCLVSVELETHMYINIGSVQFYFAFHSLKMTLKRSLKQKKIKSWN